MLNKQHIMVYMRIKMKHCNPINQCLIGSLITAPLAMQAQQQAVNLPNIIILLTDDMGKECIGSYGSTYQTPNIDKLAEEGIRFNYGFAQPLSTPSRVQLMTGKYNYKNYVEFAYLDPHQKTFAHLAKEAGYETVIAGKWQLGANNKLPAYFGFDHHCLWQLSYSRADGERYAKPLIEKDGLPLSATDDHYGPDIFVDYLLDFINADRQRPFLIYYPMVLVHDPFLPTPDSKSWQDDTLVRHQKDTANFKDMVAYTDKIVGQIIAKLKQEGLYDNTLIIFTGDNGTGQRIVTPMRDGTLVKGGKGQTLDRGVRVPLIARFGNRQLKQKNTDDLIDFTDILPTIAEVAQIEVPVSWDTDGRSFLPQIKGEKGNPREWIFSHYNPIQSPQANQYSARSFRDHRYRLYHDGRFYDVSIDPEEMNPIETGTGSIEAEAVRKRFQRELDKLPSWKPGDLGQPKHILPGYEPGKTKVITTNEQ
jgi:arylsulfatase A